MISLWSKFRNALRAYRCAHGGNVAITFALTTLISATKSLLTQLQSAASNNGDVYVSIVPFVKDVNLDPSNYSSNYIYWGTAAQDPSFSDNNSWDANNGSCSSPYSSYQTRSSCLSQASCSISGYSSQSSCTGAGTCSLSSYSSSNSCTNAGTCSNPAETSSSSCTGNKACSKQSYTSSSQCTSHGYTWGYGTWSKGVWTPGVWTAATWTPDNHNTWNGCVMDRGNSTAPDTVGNYDTNAAAPSASPLVTSTLYP